jgi:hypothetical protein
MGYKLNPFTGKFDEVGAGSATSPGGSDTEIQYNDDGDFGGSADLTWDDTGKVLEVGGDINLDDGGTYTTTLQVVTPTAARTISFPDATGTVALVAGSSGQLLYNNAGVNAGASTLTYDGSILTSSGRFINSYNATASSPAKAFTGTWFTGGTSTTTKPQVVIEPTGTTSTAWSTSGTGLGVNAASGFAGNLLDLQVNGTSNFRVSSGGALALQGNITCSPASINIEAGSVTARFGDFAVTSQGIGNDAAGLFYFSNTANNASFSFLDLALARDAANTLAQRNGTNAQASRVYNTFTSATDYERGKSGWERSTSDATTNGFISGTTLTVDSGTGIAAGQIVTGTGVTAGTRIISGSGTAWVVSQSQTVGTTGARVAMIFGAPALRVGTEKGSAGGTARPMELQTDGTTRINIAANGDLGFFGATPVAQQTELTDELTTITHTAPGTADFAIQNLVAATGYGFVTEDEGNTVLSVIANLQARVNELETKLVALGFLADAD